MDKLPTNCAMAFDTAVQILWAVRWTGGRFIGIYDRSLDSKEQILKVLQLQVLRRVIGSASLTNGWTGKEGRDEGYIRTNGIITCIFFGISCHCFGRWSLGLSISSLPNSSSQSTWSIHIWKENYIFFVYRRLCHHLIFGRFT